MATLLARPDFEAKGVVDVAGANLRTMHIGKRWAAQSHSSHSYVQVDWTTPTQLPPPIDMKSPACHTKGTQDAVAAATTQVNLLVRWPGWL